MKTKVGRPRVKRPRSTIVHFKVTRKDLAWIVCQAKIKTRGNVSALMRQLVLGK